MRFFFAFGLKKSYVCLILLSLLLCLLLPNAVAKISFPRPYAAINDFASVIPSDTKKIMENLAEELLQKTGTAVVVATVQTVSDSDPETYANELYENWGIGKKGEDKGVLIFLALQERRVRIETGYGVEGILPDGRVGSMLDEYVVPPVTEGCIAGISFLFISYTGTVHPCGYLPLDCGNLRKTSLWTIWENSALFQDLRNPHQYRGRCGHCDFLHVCRGCRARAYAETGNYMEEDRYCIYEPISHTHRAIGRHNTGR